MCIVRSSIHRGWSLKLNVFENGTTCEQWVDFIKKSLSLVLWLCDNNGHANKQTKELLKTKKIHHFQPWSHSMQLKRVFLMTRVSVCVCARCLCYYDLPRSLSATIRDMVMSNDCHNSDFGGKTLSIAMVQLHPKKRQHSTTSTLGGFEKIFKITHSILWEFFFVQKTWTHAHTHTSVFAKLFKLCIIYIWENIKYWTFIIDLLYF